MSRYTGPVTKVSRRLGLMLFSNVGESKTKAFQKKNYKPGQHGQKAFGQKSEYKRQLEAKQAAKAMYGITEKQSKRYYEIASKSNEVTGIKYMMLLEQRIDNVIYRSGIAQTRPQARQLVSHGLIALNGKRIKTPSIQVSAGDKFEVRERSKNSPMFESIKNEKVKSPKWINCDLKNLKGEVSSLPDKEDIDRSIENHLITEYYSK